MHPDRMRRAPARPQGPPMMVGIKVSVRRWGAGWPMVLFLVFLGVTPSLHAAPPDFTVPIQKGTVLNLPARADKITVGDEAIADIRLLDPNHLYVVGQGLGSTNIVLCGKHDCFRTLRLEVTHDLESLKYKLHEIFPNEHPKIYSSQNAIVIAGQVSSVEKVNAILAIATTFADTHSTAGTEEGRGGRERASGQSLGQQQAGQKDSAHPGVINLMQVGGPQQVMLGVTVAEMNTSLARRLKVDFSAVGVSGDFSAGAVNGDALISALTQAMSIGAGTINPAGLFFRFVGTDAAVKTVINAARENGLAKVLAEPNLTTISGEDAEFVSGGEFPVPIPQFGAVGGTGGGITVQFKEYGVILKFLPVVLDTNRISLKLNISVSEISEDNAVKIPAGDTDQSYNIPSLTKRSASSTLELDDGQTLGIAGLISDRTRELITKFPGLGDIPVLGQLFTSQQYLRRETELVIFVTPHLAKPIDPSKIELPTDHYVEPDDTEFYLMGRTEGLEKKPRYPSSLDNTGGLRGHFGQTPP